MKSAVSEQAAYQGFVEAKASVSIAMLVVRLARMRLTGVDKKETCRARDMAGPAVGIGLHAVVNKTDHCVFMGVPAIPISLEMRAQHFHARKIRTN